MSVQYSTCGGHSRRYQDREGRVQESPPVGTATGQKGRRLGGLTR